MEQLKLEEIDKMNWIGRHLSRMAGAQSTQIIKSNMGL